MFEGSLQSIANEESIFGNLEEAIVLDKNPKVIIKNIREKMQQDSHIHFTKMYMTCGTEDDLIENNRELRDFLLENGVDLTYREGPGKHNWEFWDAYIKKVLDWLPLDDTSSGVNSGNIII